KNLGLQTGYYLPDYPDPADYPKTVYASEAAVKNGFNTANFRDKTIDRLLTTYGATQDNRRRTDLVMQMLQIAAERAAYLPVYWEDVPLALRSKLAYRGFNSFWYFQNLGEHITAR